MEIKGNTICFYICNSSEDHFSNQGRGSQFSKVLWAKSIFRFRVELRKADISVGEASKEAFFLQKNNLLSKISHARQDEFIEDYLLV